MMTYINRVRWQFKLLEGFRLQSFLKLKKKAFSRFIVSFNSSTSETISAMNLSNSEMFDMELVFFINSVSDSAWGSTCRAIEYQLPYSEYGLSWIVLKEIKE